MIKEFLLGDAGYRPTDSVSAPKLRAARELPTLS